MTLTSRSFRSWIVGRPASAVAVTCAAVVAAAVAARRVAVTDSYLAIQYALPTYDGSAGPLFVVLAAGLLALATLAALVGAGLVPTVALAGAPVFGWAVNHFSSSISPSYAPTFPLEMALLYGGVVGVAGYLLGRGLRRVASRPDGGRPFGSAVRLD